ncbi:hypothetical protein TrVE_jg5803 [Triparma verrucosa]|uniref:J domain-containing protein n=2 Tax=Triparma TaxID=722752 RepID=A0A9W7F1A9_9STRA|nr:hypothetical protein TrST_g8965 [Triparma strigata]GMI09264.1 hypothetical protein TrVE_jg5803 [Triparma verrucosa]
MSLLLRSRHLLRPSPLPSLLPHLPLPSSPQKRSYKTTPPLLYTSTPPSQSASLLAGLAGVALVTQVVRQGAIAYDEFSKQSPEEETTDDGKKKVKRKNFFDQFGFSGPSKHYEGGFEDDMSRREAALILGIRESASSKRIKDAHRNILIANHPDTGGSNYLASKVNEAKELLMKGKESS